MKYIYIILTTAVPIAIFVYASDHKVFSSQSPPTSFQTGGCLGPACFWMGRQQSCHYPGVCWFCWVVAVVCFFVFFWPIQASTGSANMSLMISWLPWGNQKIGSAKKAWWLRGKRWVTPRECEFLEVGRLHPWMFDLWNLFYGGKFCNAVTYKFVFWNLWKPSESFHYCVNVTYEVNWSNMLELWTSVDLDGCIWSRFAEVTRGLADIGCPACDPDIFPLKIWMNRQCMKSCGGNCCRFWAWYHRTS